MQFFYSFMSALEKYFFSSPQTSPLILLLFHKQNSLHFDAEGEVFGQMFYQVIGNFLESSKVEEGETAKMKPRWFKKYGLSVAANGKEAGVDEPVEMAMVS